MRPPHFRERIARKAKGKVVAYIDVDETRTHVEICVHLNGEDFEKVRLTKSELKAALRHIEDRERDRSDRAMARHHAKYGYNRCVGSFQGKRA